MQQRNRQVTNHIKPKSTESAVERATRFLRAGLSSNAWIEGSRLPLLSELARQAHVSNRAMGQAIQACCANGALVCVRRSGIHRPAAHVFSTKPVQEKKWLQVRAALVRDIYDGKFASREPMTYADLQERYLTCYAVVKQAVSALIAEGLASASRRRLILGASYARQARSSVLFVSSGPLVRPQYIRNDWLRESVRTIETQSAKSEILFSSFGVATTSEEGARAMGLRLHAALKKDGLLGVILWASDILPDDLQIILDAAGKQKMPCALLNDNSSEIRVNELRLPSTLKVFQAAAVDAGKEMGRHLLRQGHRVIAYVSPFHGHQWSRDRMAGLEDAVRQSGRGGEIRRFVSSDQVDARQDLGSQPFFPANSTGIKKAQRRLSASSGGGGMLKRLFELDHTSSGFAFLSGLSALLRPALVDICNNREITAVVAANDTVALVIEEFLLQERTSIPDRFALAGFDDTPIAFEYDMTSYNFDFTSLAHRALSYVLYPKQFSRSMPDRIIECPGILMQRGSTRVFLS